MAILLVAKSLQARAVRTILASRRIGPLGTLLLGAVAPVGLRGRWSDRRLGRDRRLDVQARGSAPEYDGTRDTRARASGVGHSAAMYARCDSRSADPVRPDDPADVPVPDQHVRGSQLARGTQRRDADLHPAETAPVLPQQPHANRPTSSEPGADSPADLADADPPATPRPLHRTRLRRHGQAGLSRDPRQPVAPTAALQPARLRHHR